MSSFPHSLWTYTSFFQPWLLFCYDGRVADSREVEVNILNARAWLIRSGRARVQAEDGTEAEAGPGQWLMVQPGRLRQGFDPETTLLSINFKINLYTGQQLFVDGLSRVLAAKAYPDLEPAAVDLVREVSIRVGKEERIPAYKMKTDLCGYLAMQGKLLRWIDVWCAALLKEGLEPMLSITEDSRVTEAMSFLRHHRGLEYSRAPEEAAAHVGLSLAQLTRLFRKATGRTVRKYHEKLCLERAFDQLTHTDHSIKEIAMDLGFRHPSHFTMWFTKQSGGTPTDFRKKASVLPRN